MSCLHFILLVVAFLNTSPAQGGDDPVLQGRSLEEWTKDLKSSDPNKKIPAIVVMGLLGPKAKEAVPTICDALRDRQVEVRVAAAEALGRIGPDDQSLAALMLAESDSDPDVRRIVGTALTRLYPVPKDRVAGLLRVATSPSPAAGHAEEAVFRLRMRTADRDTVLMLVERLRDPKQPERTARMVVSLLSQSGPAAKDAVPPLLSLLQESKDARLRVQAIHVLGSLRQEERLVVPALAKLYASRETSAEEKRALTGALASFGPAAREALPVLRAALNDPDFQLRLEAAAAVLAIDPQDPQAIPALITVMRQGGVGQRALAIHTLSQYRPAAKAAVRELGEALADPDPHVARFAVQALSELHKDAKPAQPALVKATSHANRTVREMALRVLVTLQPTEKEAVDRLLVLEKDPDPKIRALANDALITALNRESSRKAHYRQQLTQEDRARRKAVFRLARQEFDIYPEIVDLALEFLKHESTEIRQDAAQLLSWANYPRGRQDLTPHLRVALKDQDEGVRIFAILGLRRSITQEEALPLLLPGLRHQEKEVRLAASRALQIHGPAAKAALPIYLEWLKADDAEENEQAAKGLLNLETEAKSTVPALSEALIKKPSTRHHLVKLISILGPDAKAAISGLRHVARLGPGQGQEKDEDVLQAAFVWWFFDPTDKEPPTIVERFTQHPDQRLRNRAKAALKERP